MENGICNDYVTEKLWRPLFVGTIPIVMGSPTIKVSVFLYILAQISRQYDSLNTIHNSKSVRLEYHILNINKPHKYKHSIM